MTYGLVGVKATIVVICRSVWRLLCDGEVRACNRRVLDALPGSIDRSVDRSCYGWDGCGYACSQRVRPPNKLIEYLATDRIFETAALLVTVREQGRLECANDQQRDT